jgi:hypothetical protein
VKAFARFIDASRPVKAMIPPSSDDASGSCFGFSVLSSSSRSRRAGCRSNPACGRTFQRIAQIATARPGSSWSSIEGATKIEFDPHRCRDVNQLIDAWLPLTLAMNSINRSRGQPDLYPFVLSPSVIDKLSYIGNLIHAA